VVAEAPDGVKRLRELVLQLAVRGKLVPQDPGEEPAGVLLERIAAEKARLVKAGKVRKAEALPPVRAEEVPFEVPDSWAWARFASVAAIASNLVKPSDYPDEPHVAPDNIEKGTGRLMATRTVRQDGVTSANHRFFAGQVLYSKIRPNLSKAAVVDFDGLCSADMYPIDAAIERGYLLRFILSLPFVEQVTSDDNRLAMPKVNQEQLSVVLVSVPPLKEQHRIVARVDELMGLLDRLEAARKDRDATRDAARDSALAALRDADTPDEVEVAWNRIAERMPELFTRPADLEPLRQAVLQLAVRGRLVRQDPNDEPASVLLERIVAKTGGIDTQLAFEPPRGWVWGRLGQIATLINGDRSKNYPNAEEYVSDGLAFINTGHIRPRGKLSIEAMHYISREKFDSLRSGKIAAGDLVYCLRGATLGKTAMVHPFVEGAIASSLVIIRLADPRLAGFVFLFLTGPLGKAEIRKYDNGSAQPNLAAKSVADYLIPLPPLAEQHRIVAKVDALMALIDQLEARLTAAVDLHAQFAAAAVHHLDA
jgi:type I restriction enzyme S subunit